MYLSPTKFEKVPLIDGKKGDIKWYQLSFTTRACVVLSMHIGCGTLVFSAYGGMTPLDACYFSVVTLCSVGYGDLNLEGDPPSMKIFGIVYILVGIAIMTTVLSYLVGTLLEMEESMIVDVIEKRKKRSSRRSGSPGYMGTEDIGRGKSRLYSAICVFILLVIIGTVFFEFDLKISFLDSLYMVVASAATVGYGDIAPNTNSSKAFCIVFLPIVTLALAKILTDYSKLQIDVHKRNLHNTILYRHIEKDIFSKMDKNNDNRVDTYEWLVATLIDQGKIDQKDVDDAEARFKELDFHNNGYLDARDLGRFHSSKNWPSKDIKGFAAMGGEVA